MIVCIQKQDTPEQREQALEAETSRISQLTPLEQQQIEQDYNLALSLAFEEMGYATSNVFDLGAQGAPSEQSGRVFRM